MIQKVSLGRLCCFHDFHHAQNMPVNCEKIFTSTPAQDWLFFDRVGKLRGRGLKDIASLISHSKDFPLGACLPNGRYESVRRAEPLSIACTGLGGSGLRSPQWDICLRT